jgi:hypothetical protein
MAVQIVFIASVVAAVWWWEGRTWQARHARGGGEVVSLLGYEDLPPIGAFEPLPDETGMQQYVESGLERLDNFLSGRDQNA